MGLFDAIHQKRQDLPRAEGLETEILDIFLRQPTNVGIGIGFLKPLDLSNSDHREIFTRAVTAELQEIKKRLSFQQHTIADRIFNETLALL